VIGVNCCREFASSVTTYNSVAELGDREGESEMTDDTGATAADTTASM